MFPIFVEFGNFPIHTYGPLLALAFLLAAFWSSILAREAGLPSEKVGDLALVALVGGIAGARFFYLLAFPEEFASHPLSVFYRRDGFVYYGGFLIAAPAVWFQIRRADLPLWRTADVVGPALALGQGIGRLACFSQGCCYGAPTKVWWGMIFPLESPAGYAFPGRPLHPTQLYESFGAFALAGLLYYLFRRNLKNGRPGRVFAAYLVGYGILRFAVEIFRSDLRGPSLAGLSFSQGISIGVLALGLAGLYFFRRAGAEDAARA